MSADRHNVAALIPCYFEERHIRDVAARTRAQLDKVLVVDDGSTDRTTDEARGTGVEVIRHEKNQGKGGAIKTGLRELTSRDGIEWILILDGDGQHLPEEIPHFLAAANEQGASMIVGNRMSDTRKMPLVRKLTNLTMSGLISAIIGQRVPEGPGIRIRGHAEQQFRFRIRDAGDRSPARAQDCSGDGQHRVRR